MRPGIDMKIESMYQQLEPDAGLRVSIINTLLLLIHLDHQLLARALKSPAMMEANSSTCLT